MTNRFSNQLGANEAKESLLRTWYNLDVAHDFDAGAAEDPEPEILCETGSEEEEATGGLLLETTSDSDVPLCPSIRMVLMMWDRCCLKQILCQR